MTRFFTKHFHRVYYASDNTYLRSYWQGTRVLKCPLDLWIYQELLHTLKPDLIIETGTAHGGSARYLASLFDLMGHGEIITVDASPAPDLPAHPRVTYLTGSSTSPQVAAQMTRAARGRRRVMVILDSDHSAPHVLAEMRLYAPLVTAGSYLIVEDTHMRHPVPPFRGDGPMEAVVSFLQENQDFVVDRNCERLFMSFNYSGYLRRIGPVAQ